MIRALLEAGGGVFVFAAGIWVGIKVLDRFSLSLRK
jgi:hypothetical protein